MKNIKDKRAYCTKYILNVVRKIELARGKKNAKTDNFKRYEEFFSKMSDADFIKYMGYLESGLVQIYVTMPNTEMDLDLDKLFSLAKEVDLELFEQIWMTDPTTDKRYKTPHKYLILETYVRRVRQYHDNKISLPEDDRSVDALTGQMIKPSKASSFSYTEIQNLAAREFDNTNFEYVKCRGGDIHAYANLKSQAEKTGTMRLSELDSNTRSRTAVTMQNLLRSIHITTNIVE